MTDNTALIQSLLEEAEHRLKQLEIKKKYLLSDISRTEKEIALFLEILEERDGEKTK